jgi:hypothetical protein
MGYPKWLAIGSVVLFGVIGTTALLRREPAPKQEQVAVAPAPKPTKAEPVAAAPKPPAPVNRIEMLFSPRGTTLPIAETVTYSSRASWQKGRAAWIADYARHHATSTHFIARSLNARADYEVPPVANGDRFNVLRDGNWSFYLLVDASRHQMYFYYLDHDKNTRTLIKTYDVGLGRADANSPSRSLTPLGKYQLGQRTAVFAPGVQGSYRGQQIEMVRVFGTRWIPFEKEVANCTAPAKGLGLHGAPWKPDTKSGKLIEDRASVGGNESDGCIRLKIEDIEELYAVISTRPTTIEIVSDITTANLPGKEVNVG